MPIYNFEIGQDRFNPTDAATTTATTKLNNIIINLLTDEYDKEKRGFKQ
jgi:hypothetical protein